MLRAAVTLAALAVYAVGARIPLPGVDVAAFESFRQSAPLSAAIGRISIFALGMVPLLSALLLWEIARLIAAPLARWEAASPDSAQDIAGWVRIGALALAVIQALGIASALESVEHLVPEPGLSFRAGCVATLVAATALLVWLADTITRRGLGNGFLILLAAPFAGALVTLLIPDADPALFGSQLGDAQLVTFLYLGASCVGLAALTSMAPSLLPSGQLLWPPLLALSAVGWMLAGLYLALPADWEPVLTSAQTYGHPARLVLLIGLTAAFYALRARTLPLQHAEPNGPPPHALAAVALIAILLLGEILLRWVRLPLPIDGRSAFIVSLATLSVLASVRRHAAGTT